jgi:hypothetical protein
MSPPKDQSPDTIVKKTPEGRISGTGKELEMHHQCSGLSRELSGQNSLSDTELLMRHNRN